MNQKEYRKLISCEDARLIISKMNLKTEMIEMQIKEYQGHVLAQDVIAGVDVPGFDRASMDGFAVRAKDTYSAREDRPVILTTKGRLDAGCISEITVDEGTAIEVSTGAMMPKGADSVVMVEYTRLSINSIKVVRPVSVGENVIYAGSDIMIGERVVEAGTKLTAREIGVLAAVGADHVNVKHLTVGIISTGSELVEPDNKLAPGKVYDINSYTLGSAVKECGANVRYYGIVRDNRSDMEKILDQAVNECHLVLTSGSTSAGIGDMMYRIIEDKGEVLFHGINIKPGKPVIAGMINDTPVFGLPGYPTSALTIFNEFTAPLIRRSLWQSDSRSTVSARMAVEFRSSGRNQLLPVGLVRGLAYPVDKGSGAITTLAYADGFIEIEPGVEILAAKEEVKVTLLGDVKSPDIFFIGSHCLGFESLMRLLPYKVRVINTGSTGALTSVRDGIADIGGIHLLDDKGVYNTSFIETFGVKNAVIVKGYLREQGLITRPDTDILGFEDIPGHRMINRNRGSGTRVFTDIKLHQIADEQGIGFDELCASLEGYDTEARTHSAVAAAVKFNRADVGVGIRSAAQLNDLKFVHLADEEYDFIVQREFIESKMGKDFLDFLCSQEFSQSLPPGIRTYEKTGNF
jgi:putative molybdopterin biosynthesis protein